MTRRVPGRVMRSGRAALRSAWSTLKNALQGMLQSAHGIRFGNHGAKPILSEVGHNWVLCIPAGNNRFHLGVESQQAGHGFLATHASRDGDVENCCRKGLACSLGVLV